MRYSFRTLFVIAALAPPALAWFWFAFRTQAMPDRPYSILRPDEPGFHSTINEAGAPFAAGIMALVVTTAIALGGYNNR